MYPKSDMKDRKFILWGATGQAKVVADIIDSHGGSVTKIFDNRHVVSPLENIEIGYGLNDFDAWLKTVQFPQNYSAIATIGGSYGFDRFEFYEMFCAKELVVPSISHKTAVISKSAIIGQNVQILALAFVGVEAIVGDASIINTRASVDHESKLGRGVHIAPNATLCGCVEVGDFSMIGASSVVLPRIKIGMNTVIGAGSVVTKNIPDNVIAYGNPAKIIRGQKIVR
jgi:sugar O-acyltransferase (sialic acid O-acetyltransferase NeuD family)